MARNNLYKRVLLPTLAATAMIVTCSSVAISNTALTNGQTVSGEIAASASVTRWSVPSGFLGFGSKEISGPSQEFTFQADKGNFISIELDNRAGSTFKPMMILVGPNGRAVTSETGNSARRLSHFASEAGTYRLVVLGGADTSGRATTGKYTVRVSGLSAPTTNTATGTTGNTAGGTTGNTAGGTTVANADQVMKNLGLTSMSCGLPNVSQVLIGGDIRCTTQLNAPNRKFVYNTATQRLEGANTATTTTSNSQNRTTQTTSTTSKPNNSTTQTPQSAASAQQAPQSVIKVLAFESGRYQKLVQGSGTNVVALDSDDTGVVFLAPTSSNPPDGQYLQFIPEPKYRGTGYYRITSKYAKAPNLYLQIDTTDPKNLVVKMGPGEPGNIAPTQLNQLWRVMDVGNGDVWISNAFFDSQTGTIKKVLENSGGKLEMHDTDLKTPEQKFKLERLSARTPTQ